MCNETNLLHGTSLCSQFRECLLNQCKHISRQYDCNKIEWCVVSWSSGQVRKSLKQNVLIQSFHFSIYRQHCSWTRQVNSGTLANHEDAPAGSVRIQWNASDKNNSWCASCLMSAHCSTWPCQAGCRANPFPSHMALSQQDWNGIPKMFLHRA